METTYSACQALEIKKGKACGILSCQKFCQKHRALLSTDYHRFDYYHSLSSFDRLARTQLGCKVMLLREDLKEMIYAWIISNGNENIGYILSEKEELQKKIDSRIREYFSPGWAQKLVARITPRAKTLGEDLVKGSLADSSLLLRDLKRFDRLAFVLLRLGASRGWNWEDLNTHRSNMPDVLFLILAIEEIVFQERLEHYLLSGLERIPLEPGDAGDVKHAIPLIECRAIVLYLRRFLAREGENSENEIYLSSAQWEFLLERLLSQEEKIDTVISLNYRHSRKILSEKEKEYFERTRKEMRIIAKCHLEEKESGKKFLEASSFFLRTKKNLAEEFGLEDLSPPGSNFERKENIFDGLLLVAYPYRAQEMTYAYFKW